MTIYHSRFIDVFIDFWSGLGNLWLHGSILPLQTATKVGAKVGPGRLWRSQFTTKTRKASQTLCLQHQLENPRPQQQCKKNLETITMYRLDVLDAAGPSSPSQLYRDRPPLLRPP